MTVRAWLRWPALVALGAVLVLIALQGSLGADETRTTWDFEGEDALDGWTSANAALTIAPGEGIEGSQAAGITIETLQLRASAEVSYPLTIHPGAKYEFGGVYVSTDGNIDGVRLDIVFRDKSGEFLHMAGDDLISPGSWQPEAAQALCDAAQGHLRILTRGEAGAIVYIDNLFLKENTPTTPCPTPVPSQTLTSTPSPSQTPTSTPSPSHTPTSTPSPSQTPTATLSPSQTPTATPSTSQTPTSTPSTSQTPTSTPSTSQTPTSTDTATPTTDPTSPPSHTPAATATPSQTATDQPATATNTPPGATATEPPPDPASLEFSNGGFEEGEDGAPHAWEHFGGVLMRTGTPARTGSWAGALFSSTNSTKWAFQTVNVEPAGWYEFQAFVYNHDPWVESALLRISWYASANGSGSAVAAVDSRDLIASPAPEFRRISTGPVMAPPGVHSAKVRVLMRPRDGTSAVIYIDDASFGNVAAPIPPTSTPALTPPTATPTPASTSTSTNTPTAQPTTVPASPAPADTPQPADTPPPADTATPVLAAVAANTPTSAPEPTAIAATLANAGFESAVEGVLDTWQTFGGLLMQVDSPVRSGAAAGGFFSSSGSTKWIYQTVAVEPAAWYQFDAFVYHNHAFVEEVLLRISWYASADGSGSALASVDSTNLLTSPEARYRPLTTGPVQAPPGARSAKLRILVRPRDERSALINVDDVSFERVVAPAVVEVTPAPVSAAASSRVLSSFEPAAPSVNNQRPATTNQRPATTNQRPSHAPMPAPVLRRHALQTPEPLAPREGDPLWPWTLLGATSGAGIVGWGAYLALRRRQDAGLAA